MKDLRPIDIYFSQDSINNRFDQRSAHSYACIGETLDSICEGRCSVYDIPTISVAKVDNRWVTADNRRLWVFRELYRLNKVDTVPVNVTYGIPSSKMTSYNNGVSIDVRRGPGGKWHRKRTVRSSTPSAAVSKPVPSYSQPAAHHDLNPKPSVYKPVLPKTTQNIMSFGSKEKPTIYKDPYKTAYSSNTSSLERPTTTPSVLSIDRTSSFVHQKPSTAFGSARQNNTITSVTTKSNTQNSAGHGYSMDLYKKHYNQGKQSDYSNDQESTQYEISKTTPTYTNRQPRTTQTTATAKPAVHYGIEPEDVILQPRSRNITYNQASVSERDSQCCCTIL